MKKYDHQEQKENWGYECLWFSRNGLQALITGNLLFLHCHGKTRENTLDPRLRESDERRRGNDERKQASITPAIKIKKENYFYKKTVVWV